MKRVLATMLCLATASVSMAGEWVFFVATGEVGNKIQYVLMNVVSAENFHALLVHDLTL